MREPQTVLNSASPETTARVAGELARRLAPGDTVLLSGGVGAGKTHFARAAIASLLDAPEDIPSPTYTLVQTYDGRSGEIWHADLYRLTSPGELEELGLREAFGTAICFVEWPEQLGALRPASALAVTIEAQGPSEERRLSFAWSGGRWAEALAGFQDD